MLLDPENPERGYIDMSEANVHIESGGKIHDIAMIEINNMEFVKNKSILWLVMGGVIASLSGVGFVKSIINPWESLVYIVFGVLLFYYGWQGKSMLQINYQLHKKVVIRVNDDQLKWHNFIAAFRELRARY